MTVSLFLFSVTTFMSLEGVSFPEPLWKDVCEYGPLLACKVVKTFKVATANVDDDVRSLMYALMYLTNDASTHIENGYRMEIGTAAGHGLLYIQRLVLDFGFSYRSSIIIIVQCCVRLCYLCRLRLAAPLAPRFVQWVNDAPVKDVEFSDSFRRILCRKTVCK